MILAAVSTRAVVLSLSCPLSLSCTSAVMGNSGLLGLKVAIKVCPPMREEKELGLV